MHLLDLKTHNIFKRILYLHLQIENIPPIIFLR